MKNPRLEDFLDEIPDGTRGEHFETVEPVPTPESADALLGSNGLEAGEDGPLKTLTGLGLGVEISDLEQKLDSVEWGRDSTGKYAGNGAGKKIS